MDNETPAPLQTAAIDHCTDSPTDDYAMSRRRVLQIAATAPTAILTPTTLDRTTSQTPPSDPHPLIPTTPHQIHDAFADVPHIQNPTQRQREIAAARYPAAVVPDDGPIPDPPDHVTVRIEAPPWALAAAYDVARRAVERGEWPSRRAITDQLLDLAYAHEEWVLADGSDAVDAVLTAATV